MTYNEVMTLAQVYLISDNKLPSDEPTRLALIEDALIEVADRAASMRLTSQTAGDVLRLGPGDKLLVRMPGIPSDPDEQIDMDHELGGAVARFIAAVVSKEKGEKHVAAAVRRILNYNAKVYDTIDSLCSDNRCNTLDAGTYVEDEVWG